MAHSDIPQPTIPVQKVGRRKYRQRQNKLQGIPKSVTWQRRELVTRLRSQGMSAKEIHAELIEHKFLNPNQDTPFSLDTVMKDIKDVDDMYIQRALMNIDVQKKRQLEELAHVRYCAWAKSEYKLVLETIRLECEILGTLAPRKNQLDEVVKNLIEKYRKDA